MKCPKCNVEMKPGIAIESKYTRCCLVIMAPVLTNAENMRIINVLKCPKCGHSDEGKMYEYRRI